MTAAAAVGGNGDRGVDRGDGAPRIGVDERLVAESDDDRRGSTVTRDRDTGAERAHLTVGPPLVDHVDDRLGKGRLDLSRGHDDDGSDAGGQGRADRPIEDGPVADHGIELVALARETGARAGGENDGDDVPERVPGCRHRPILARIRTRIYMNGRLRNRGVRVDCCDRVTVGSPAASCQPGRDARRMLGDAAS